MITLAPVILLVLIIFISLPFISMKEFSLLKLYLVIISVVGLIGAVVGYGNFGYQIITHSIITPEEYALGSYDNYQITQCETSDNNIKEVAPGVTTEAPTTPTTTSEIKKRTPEEIKACKETAKKNIIARREFDYKNNLISGIVWGTLFLILFLTHFPVFFKKYKLEGNK